MTLPQFALAFLVLDVPFVYWMWWFYSKAHPEGRWRRLFVGTAVLGGFIVLFSGWLYTFDHMFPGAGVLTQKGPTIIVLVPAVVALALAFACILMVWVARIAREQ